MNLGIVILNLILLSWIIYDTESTSNATVHLLPPLSQFVQGENVDQAHFH